MSVWSSTHLEVSRLAVDLFLDQGFDQTSVEQIAERSGRSPRTVWRYFGSKQSCAEPLLASVTVRFVDLLVDWPLGQSIESYLETIRQQQFAEDEVADDLSALRLVARLSDAPELRPVWLIACSQGETKYASVVARRSGLRIDDFEVRLCSAATLGAVRVFYEEAGTMLKSGSGGTAEDRAQRLAAAIRAASTLPICDPIKLVRDTNAQ